jgi:hypothetical protein
MRALKCAIFGLGEAQNTAHYPRGTKAMAHPKFLSVQELAGRRLARIAGSLAESQTSSHRARRMRLFLILPVFLWESGFGLLIKLSLVRHFSVSPCFFELIA